VRVAEGPFASFNGLVEEVDEERSRLKVELCRSLAGQRRLNLEFGQVDKALGHFGLVRVNGGRQGRASV
jgi:transcriptional antiterminator NusG